mmetsp:Transcript_4343/g.15278  ORF Transcript_4343/g.15278 Transcript_4343/m.15278 type:complete len:369 (-) Transcript_4343:250-1356(-)
MSEPLPNPLGADSVSPEVCVGEEEDELGVGGGVAGHVEYCLARGLHCVVAAVAELRARHHLGEHLVPLLAVTWRPPVRHELVARPVARVAADAVLQLLLEARQALHDGDGDLEHAVEAAVCAVEAVHAAADVHDEVELLLVLASRREVALLHLGALLVHRRLAAQCLGQARVVQVSRSLVAHPRPLLALPLHALDDEAELGDLVLDLLEEVLVLCGVLLAHVDLTQALGQRLLCHSPRTRLHLRRDVALLLVRYLVHLVALVQPVRPALAPQSSSVCAAGTACPGVAADVGLVVGVLLAVLGGGGLAGVLVLDPHLVLPRLQVLGRVHHCPVAAVQQNGVELDAEAVEHGGDEFLGLPVVGVHRENVA